MPSHMSILPTDIAANELSKAHGCVGDAVKQLNYYKVDGLQKVLTYLGGYAELLRLGKIREARELTLVTREDAARILARCVDEDGIAVKRRSLAEARAKKAWKKRELVLRKEKILADLQLQREMKEMERRRRADSSPRQSEDPVGYYIRFGRHCSA